jgi:hypothetical protein
MPAYAVVRAYGGSGITAGLEPATIDGLVYASSMVILYAARHRVPAPSLDSGQHNPRLACSPVLGRRFNILEPEPLRNAAGGRVAAFLELRPAGLRPRGDLPVPTSGTPLPWEALPELQSLPGNDAQKGGATCPGS